ncbi:MAG TPA: DSD1 family PLP-dependent enzyme [Vicinamibacterales bacterium]|nr:DSD1 family PLP-dependent enzyme [Vicinamibacterales bacterium]
MAACTRVSRRNFLVTSGTGAAALCVSGNAGGYTSAEMKARANDESLVGISKWDLETPALCVDADKLTRNIDAMRTKLAPMKVASRPHAKTHKCPTIATMQLAGGSIGICTAKLSEAEVFAASGIQSILMTTSNVSPSKIRRAMALRKTNPQFVQAVDHPDNARDLNDAAKAAGIVADVVIDVAIGTRSGVPAGDRALALAQLVDTLHNLRLRGIISYDGGAQHIKGFKTRLDQTLNRFAPSLETFERFQKSGLSTEIFSGGGTGTYNILPRAGHVTDLQVGSYVFMDCQYLDIGGESNDEVYTDFEPSLTVVTTVLNTYFPKSITTDAGAKALTLNKPGPWVIGEKDFRYNAGSDEFGVISYETAQRSYKVGDKLELIVPHCDPAVNEYDQMYAIKDDRVTAVWPIAARGRSQ